MRQDSTAKTEARPPLAVALEGISKRFPEGTLALDSVRLTVEPGERLVVLGPSGSGKSTLLRIIAGLETATEGRVVIGGHDQAAIPAHRREVGMIFQNPALFPQMSVFENLAFGIRARENGEFVLTRVAETAAMLGLSDLLGRHPDTLSGGERRRVTVGRALAWRPRVLMLDEPFASLDAPLRASLRDQVLALHRRLGMTLIHVTHDQGEALAMGDRIAVLDRGRIVQCDTPRQIYRRPAHRFIGEFVGSPSMNILPCEVVREPDFLSIRLAGDDPAVLGIDDEPDDGPFSRLGVGERLRLDLGIRPEHLSVVQDWFSTPTLDGRPLASARVEGVEFQGHEIWIHLRFGGHILKSRNPGRFVPREGEVVRIVPSLIEASWFDPVTGLAAVGGENPFADGNRP
jgi:ABC-type sugar transport system ATPase subunit